MSFVWPDLPELDVADFGLGQLAMSSDTDSDTDDEMPALEEKFEYLNEYDSGLRLYWIPAPVDSLCIDKSKWLIVHPTANLQRDRNTFRAAQLWKAIGVSDVLTLIGSFYSAGITIERPVAEAPLSCCSDGTSYLVEVPSVPDFVAAIYLEGRQEYERQLQKMRDAMEMTAARSDLLASKDA